MAVMDSPVTPLVASPELPATLPGWALLRRREPDDLTAAFAAGIALKSPAAGGPARP